MTENPHENEDLRAPGEKHSGEAETKDEKGDWAEDQKKRSYYYDDACGYEVYNPEADEREED